MDSLTPVWLRQKKIRIKYGFKKLNIEQFGEVMFTKIPSSCSGPSCVAHLCRKWQV